jgi:hypothetical protein
MKLSDIQKAALASHKAELRRHNKLVAAYHRYALAAKKLGFWDLTRAELDDRSRELKAQRERYLTKEWADEAERLRGLRSVVVESET